MSAIETSKTSTLLPQLRATLNGQVITPNDAAYDDARKVFYGWVNRRPAVIVRPRTAFDVARFISLARDTGMELAVRSGGHSVAGHSVSEGGIVLDLSEMQALDIEAEQRTAWAETGLTAGAYTTAAGAYGLGTGFGDTGAVGIGGLTLGGGVGFLVRKYGLTIDDLLAAEVATADGRILYTDAETHPDLFWAIRGGGGNFGVATRFKFRLHEVDEVVGGMLVLPATPDVISGLISEAEGAPEELTAIVNIMPAPPMPFVPAAYHGRPVVLSFMVYAGPAQAGQSAVAPFRALATPLADMVRPMRYPEMYKLTEGGPHPVAAALHSMFVDTVDARAAETIVQHIEASTATAAVTQLRVLGGAVARVPADATAYAHRGRRIMVNLAALYERLEDAPIHDAWVTRFAAALRQGDPAVYVNFLGDEGQARLREAYPASIWNRLAAAKRRYDPTNFFHLNHNIPPA